MNRHRPARVPLTDRLKMIGTVLVIVALGVLAGLAADWLRLDQAVGPHPVVEVPITELTGPPDAGGCP